MFIEISRKKALELGGEKNAIKKGFFTVWSEKRIKSAFNFGNGTEKDFLEYRANNTKYCIFKDLSKEYIQKLIGNIED